MLSLVGNALLVVARSFGRFVASVVLAAVWVVMLFAGLIWALHTLVTAQN